MAYHGNLISFSHIQLQAARENLLHDSKLSDSMARFISIPGSLGVGSRRQDFWSARCGALCKGPDS